MPAEVAVPAAPPRRAASRRRLFGLLHVLVIYGLELLLIISALPSLALVYFALGAGGAAWPIAAIVAAGPVYVISYCLLAAAARAVVLGRVKGGVWPVESGLYLRKWFADILMEASRRLILPLFTTIYLPPWLRLLGARIGARAEVSTVWHVSPELLVAGEESFFADGAVIGRRRIFRGLFEMGPNVIGRRTFVGNSALLPVGASLGERCLVGVLSAPPADVPCTPAGSEWLGSPAFILPHRQKVGGFDEKLTYRPPAKLYAQRLMIDALRILIPGAIEAGGLVAFVLFLLHSSRTVGPWATLALTPVVAFGLAVAASLCVVAVKKLLMGRFVPVIKPLWSRFVWLNEAVNGAYESVAAPALGPLLGTPFFAPYLRLLGCKVGRHAFIETTLFSEFDLVEIGDYAALNLGAVIQTHLFEDRIMKASYLRIGDECSVGNMGVVLYDTHMQRGAKLGPLSLLMKGETLGPLSSWSGIPTGAGHAAAAAQPLSVEQR